MSGCIGLLMIMFMFVSIYEASMDLFWMSDLAISLNWG